MKIQLLKPDLNEDYIFQISNGKNIYLTSSDYDKKSICLKQLEEVLVELRDNEQIAIQSGNNNQFYFEVAGSTQSPSFKGIEAANDVLVKLKEFANRGNEFRVSYERAGEKVVSKKQLGLREELYDFSRVSTSHTFGFELIEGAQPNERFFHFNDKEGFALLYSRAFDGKTRRTKAIRSIIKNAENEERFERIQQGDNHFFIIKTSKGYEIARSRNFRNAEQMDAAINYLRENTASQKKDFKLSKKKKKKKTAKEKYHLKQIAPLGLVGFEGFKSTKNKMHYFHYHDEGGQALLISKYYEKRKDRDAGIAEVIKNGSKRKYYKTWKKNKNQCYFSIIDKKGKSYARSRYFENKKEMIAAMKHLQENVSGYEEESNVVRVTKEKIYTIQLPKKAVTEVPKAPTIPVQVEEPVIIESEIKEPEEIKEEIIEPLTKKEEQVIETILPQPGIKIETEPVIESITNTTPTPPIPEQVYESPTPFRKEIIENNTESGFPWKWIIAGLAGLLLIAFLLKNCGETPESKALPEPKVVEKPAPKPVSRPKPVEPAKLGPTALELNLKPNTAEARIADFLSTPKVKVPKTFILESVQFPFSSAVLTNTSFEQLNNVIRVMKEYPKTKIEVNGHTDSRGDDTMNLTLSQNRAKAVQNYLIKNGITADRILKAVGFGEQEPIATNDTDEGRQENRRSEVVVVER